MHLDPGNKISLIRADNQNNYSTGFEYTDVCLPAQEFINLSANVQVLAKSVIKDSCTKSFILFKNSSQNEKNSINFS